MRRVPYTFLVCIAIAATGCGTNPVTGKRELQFVSEAEEIRMGQQGYAPARQSEGGDLSVMPELTAYVATVGKKLAAVADRKLPYEFTVLNNSAPNAWAMPGGKIAVNRGLLTELKNESELAAVLGHEIVHAAARHGAKAQERGTLMQAGMVVAQIGAAVGGVDSNVAGIATAGASAGLQMAQMKYGRDQELEADEYGMTYMKRAGYDPTGAVTLQETFVRLSESKSAKAGLFDKWFASHPPSTERVLKNKERLASLGVGGELGEQQYQLKLAALTKAKPAYDKFDEANTALGKKEFAKASSLVAEATRLYPQEAHFYELQGNIELAQKRPKDALPLFEKAISLNSNYYGAYLSGGVAQIQNGNRAKAQEWLKRSSDLLPTKNAAYYLGNIARQSGDLPAATQLYKSAAGNDSDVGQLAARELVELDLSANPQTYIAGGVQLSEQGQLLVLVQNRAPVALAEIQVSPVLMNEFGGISQQGSSLRIERLNPGEQVALITKISGLSATQLQSFRVKVDSAKVLPDTKQ